MKDYLKHSTLNTVLNDQFLPWSKHPNYVMKMDGLGQSPLAQYLNVVLEVEEVKKIIEGIDLTEGNDCSELIQKQHDIWEKILISV